MIDFWSRMDKKYFSTSSGHYPEISGVPQIFLGRFSVLELKIVFDNMEVLFNVVVGSNDHHIVLLFNNIISSHLVKSLFLMPSFFILERKVSGWSFRIDPAPSLP